MQDFSSSADESGAATRDPTVEFDALQTVIRALQPLHIEAQHRILASVATFLQAPDPSVPAHRRNAGPTMSTATDRERPAFSDDTAMSPKEFLIEKQPRTDVERLACLAFYLTHYEDMQHFKTLDLSKLNTRAAQPKFTNSAQVAKNAVASGYLVSATRGHRQLSAAGEQFVRALPDQEAARSAMAAARPKRRNRRTKTKDNSTKG